MLLAIMRAAFVVSAQSSDPKNDIGGLKPIYLAQSVKSDNVWVAETPLSGQSVPPWGL